MRNFVVKHDRNRASVHTDMKKAWEPDILDGLEEHYIEVGLCKDASCDLSLHEIAVSEYERGVKASGIV